MSKIIRPMTIDDLPKVKHFADLTIGENYFTLDELREKLKMSQKNGLTSSFVLVDETTQDIQALRLSYPPGNWNKGKGKGLSPHLWKTEQDNVGYFQSLFLHPDLTGQGWGEKLSKASIEVLKKLGAKAVVCHSWVESPNNSSFKYLSKMGFVSVAQYPHYWKDVDYTCTRCGKPCLCTAEEMILYLKS